MFMEDNQETPVKITDACIDNLVMARADGHDLVYAEPNRFGLVLTFRVERATVKLYADGSVDVAHDPV